MLPICTFPCLFLIHTHIYSVWLGKKWEWIIFLDHTLQLVQKQRIGKGCNAITHTRTDIYMFQGRHYPRWNISWKGGVKAGEKMRWVRARQILTPLKRRMTIRLVSCWRQKKRRKLTKTETSEHLWHWSHMTEMSLLWTHVGCMENCDISVIYLSSLKLMNL